MEGPDPNCTSADALLAYSKIHELLEHDLLPEWPNFTNCLPVCGMCNPSPSTDPTYIVFNLCIIGILLPIIGLLGLVGNCISAFIYSRPEMRCSTNLYLCALGCSDSAVIGTAIFLFCIDSLKRYSQHLVVFLARFSPILYPAGMTAQACSVYFTLVAGGDCFVNVCLPERVRHFCSRPRFVRCVIICVVLFCILYNIPHLFEANIVPCWHEVHKRETLEVCPDKFRFNALYLEIYYKYMYTIFLAVGPLVTLIILNTVIITVSFLSKSGGADMGDNIALILVVFLFIICNMTALVLFLFEDALDDLLGQHVNYIVDMSNLLVVFNSSFNFVIYVTFSKSFRLTLHQYFFSRRSDNLKVEGVPPQTQTPPPVVVAENGRSSICKDGFGKLLLPTSETEVLI